MTFGTPWTPAEETALRVAYESGGTAAALAALPGRSAVAIWKRAFKLGLRSPRNWTEAEDNKLRWGWANNSLSELARDLGRTQQATHARAALLGLRSRCPRGMEHLTTAADRAGFSPRKLVKVLRQYAVPVVCSFARPGLSRGLRRHRFVDPTEVDMAVAEWVRA